MYFYNLNGTKSCRAVRRPEFYVILATFYEYEIDEANQNDIRIRLVFI